MFSQNSRLKGLVILFGLFIFGVAATAVLHFTGWDLAWSAQFYTAGGAHQGWTHTRDQPWAFFYDYAEYPVWVLAAFALFMCLGVVSGRVSRVYLRPSLVIILTAALGPGLLVNGILKPNWGRPRPADLTIMGGDREYKRVWEPMGRGQGKSFTCGHCAAAYSVGSAVAFYPMHPVISVVALTAGIAFGTAAGIGRLVQGGHFPTDILWSGVLILMLITALYYLVLRIPETTYESRPPP